MAGGDSSALDTSGEAGPLPEGAHLVEGLLPEEVGYVIRVRGGADAVLAAARAQAGAEAGNFGGIGVEKLGRVLERQAALARERMRRRAPPGRRAAAGPGRERRALAESLPHVGPRFESGAGGGAGPGRGAPAAADPEAAAALERAAEAERAAVASLAEAQRRAREAKAGLARARLAAVERGVAEVEGLVGEAEREGEHARRLFVMLEERARQLRLAAIDEAIQQAREAQELVA